MNLLLQGGQQSLAANPLGNPEDAEEKNQQHGNDQENSVVEIFLHGFVSLLSLSLVSPVSRGGKTVAFRLCRSLAPLASPVSFQER
jgi:hypothetical protein